MIIPNSKDSCIPNQFRSGQQRKVKEPVMIIKVKTPRGLASVITADYKKEQVTVENYTDDMLDRAFGVNEHPTWEEYNAFLESRCFPRERDLMKLYLKEVGVDFYDPIQIVQKTEGRMAEDQTWLEFEER